MVSETPKEAARRTIIKRLIAGGGITATAHLMPERWTAPVIESVILPAHAEVSSSDLLNVKPTFGP